MKNSEAPLCECGCGQKVTWNKQFKKWNRFVWCHHKRGEKFKTAQMELLNPRFCKCGCGEIVKPRSNFIRGHNSRCLSKEARENLSKGLTGHIVSEETKKKLSKANTGYKHSEKAKIKMSEARKGQTLSKEHKQKIAQSHIGKTHSKETREKLRKANLGKKLSTKTKKKMSVTRKGRKVPKKLIIKRTITRLENRQKLNVTRMDGYCDAWGDEEYKNDLRKTACEDCGMTNMMSFKLFGCKLSTHHTNGKNNCAPWEIVTLCCSCHPKWDARLKREKQK